MDAILNRAKHDRVFNEAWAIFCFNYNDDTRTYRIDSPTFENEALEWFNDYQ